MLPHAVQQVTTDSVDHGELMDVEEIVSEPEPEQVRYVYEQYNIINEKK